ncbi:unnamed protein product [Pseudo-nitzschia multistriata]|uniref:Ribonuclease H2 subunit B wHTH domain-containing protein n=1 Tax=Pseudo-nitzschia multistriata TaxID=183589 RepID=A0A448ZSE6_9STRA|nr:unnamed protein product [Pseudo-nitzschia multistriata]
MTEAHSKNKKWIVALQQERLPVGRMVGKLIYTKDPGSGDCRDYVVISPTTTADGSYIAEIQNIPADFSSFMVGRHVVKDGDLYMINRIDPLFLYLATQTIEQYESTGAAETDIKKPKTKKASWQPYNQFLEQSKLPLEVTKFITEKQLSHICSTFDNEELYFKFSMEKSLNWLKKKQVRVLESLITQNEQRRKTNELKYSAAGAENGDSMGGSVSSNFNFGNPVGVVTPPATKGANRKVEIKLDTKALKIESLQIICNYLNEAWSKAFVQHMGYTMEQIADNAKAKSNPQTISNDRNPIAPAVLTEDDLNATSSKKAAAAQKDRKAARTVGNKRLAKVSTKGMKSIGSFFGAAKAKKAKH